VPVQDLLAFINRSPTPFHAVAETVARLEARGYRRLDEGEVWEVKPADKVYVVRGGASVAAFHLGSVPAHEAGFHLVGAHSDSPNLRVKPNPELQNAGYGQLGVEPYGAVLLHTWLDRDLSLAGRVSLANGNARLVDFRRELLRIPSLAIHLNRKVNSEGLQLNAQKHMAPIVTLSDLGELDLCALLAKELGDVDASDVIAWDLMAYDLQPGTRSGMNREFIHAARIDNLASCHACLSALLASERETEISRGIVLYDHEEVGSRSAQGAASDFLRSCLQRLCGDSTEAYHRAVAKSFLISADMSLSYLLALSFLAFYPVYLLLLLLPFLLSQSFLLLPNGLLLKLILMSSSQRLIPLC